MRKEMLSVLVMAFFLAMVGAVNAENLVVNGDFSDGLNGWTFIDESVQYPISPPTATDASVVNGRVLLHAYSKSAFGSLVQYQSDSVTPEYFSMDYENYAGHTCGASGLELLDDKGEMLLNYRVGGMDVAPNYAQMFFLGEPIWYVRNDPSYRTGTLELFFDHDLMKLNVYISGVYKNSFSIPAEGVSVSAVKLYSLNGCSDGRNHQYGYFDNIVLKQYTIPDTNKGHGNDPDGVDEDNPGKGCDKKNAHGNKDRC